MNASDALDNLSAAAAGGEAARYRAVVLVTLPILGAAAVSALGTVFVRHSLRSCAVLPIAMCTLIGAACTRSALDTPGDYEVAGILAVAAFAVAAIMALLVWAAGPSGRVPR